MFPEVLRSLFAREVPPTLFALNNFFFGGDAETNVSDQSLFAVEDFPTNITFQSLSTAPDAINFPGETRIWVERQQQKIDLNKNKFE